MSIQVTTKPVTYQWWEPYYDRVLDIIQPKVYAFIPSRLARFLGWSIRLTARIVVALFWITLKVLTYTLIAAVVIGCGIIYTCGMFALGQGKVVNSMGSK